MSWLALVSLGLLVTGAPDPPKAEAVTLDGKVVELTTALKPYHVSADSDPISRQVVLLADDGSMTPLLSDEASRALFQDERLRDRLAEISGRKFPGLPYLQVLSFKVVDGGRFRTPDYYCEVCSISVRFPQQCPCCQGPMQLRMKPEAP